MKKKPLKVIGCIAPDWLERQLRLEDNMVFAKQENYVPKYEYKRQELNLSATAKYVFGRSIALFKL